jgi:hypothetical protein
MHISALGSLHGLEHVQYQICQTNENLYHIYHYDYNSLIDIHFIF